MDHFTLKDGVLHAEDVALPDIADAVGTPVYVYSTATIERHVAVFKAALANVESGPLGPLIAFAVKANPNRAVLATLAKAGLGADVVSGGELMRARAAGIAADRIVFSGVGKTADEMRLGLREGIFQFNVESEPEAEMLSAVAIETVPSSSTSIFAPVSSTKARITLPPGPITSRILSGLILILMIRGAWSDISARGSGRACCIALRMWRRPFFACSSASAII